MRLSAPTRGRPGDAATGPCSWLVSRPRVKLRAMQARHRSGPGQWYEVQCRRIHAIAQAGGPRSIVEDMPEVTVAAGAGHRNAGHAEAVVGAFEDVAPGDGSVKAGPAGAGMELGIGVVERRRACGAAEDAGAVEVPVLAG